VSEWSYVSSRLGNITDATKAVAKEIFEVAKNSGHDIWFIWGIGTSAEHSTGRALDLMVRSEPAGDFVRNYIWNNRERFSLVHVIWEQHITSTVVSPGIRRPMEDRGDFTANHYDHVHLFRFNTPYSPLSVAPAAKLVVDGVLGPKTIRSWQKVMRTPVDGVIDEKNSALVRAVQIRLQNTVDYRLVVDGVGIRQDDNFYKTVAALQRYLKSPVDGRISVPRSQVIMALQRRLNENRF